MIPLQELHLSITRITKAISFATLLGIVGTSFAQDDHAQRYLMRSLAGDYHTNIVAVMKQRQSGDKGSVIVKIQKSKDGKTRETVLSPLHLQCEYLDNGTSIETYSPDEKTLIIQPANQLSQDLAFRTPLIQRNYSVKLEAKRKIAGRSCVVVIANARYTQIPSIRYFFDEKTGFPLSKETIRPDGDVTTEYEVVEVKFPSRIEPSVFKIEPPVGYETVSYAEPTKINSISEAASMLGFSPIVPAQIPYGFKVQRMTTTKNSKWKALCLKMTDGLQRVTVYEWVPEPGETIKTGENRVIRLHNGINVMIVSDIDSNIRNILIRSFLVMADRDSSLMLTSIGI
jgi:outer membrane lipoprotein-sorting protein